MGFDIFMIFFLGGYVMDLMEAIQGRRSIRKFKKDPVSEDDLKEIVTSATLAANAENAQMWYFVAVTNRELIEKIGDAVSTRVDAVINACKTLGKEKAFADHKYFLVFFREAPAVIAVFVRPFSNAIDKALDIVSMQLKTPMTISSAQQSIGAAVQNLALAAHSKGYGTTSMLGPVLAYKEIGELLEAPESSVLAALIPIGIPAHNPKARPRLPLEQVYRLVK
jgi:nitroreductase